MSATTVPTIITQPITADAPMSLLEREDDRRDGAGPATAIIVLMAQTAERGPAGVSG